MDRLILMENLTNKGPLLALIVPKRNFNIHEAFLLDNILHSGKKCALGYSNILHITKAMVLSITFQLKVLCGNQNGSSMASHFGTFIAKSACTGERPRLREFICQTGSKLSVFEV